jgi:hypothetical protein
MVVEATGVSEPVVDRVVVVNTNQVWRPERTNPV